MNVVHLGRWESYINISLFDTNHNSMGPNSLNKTINSNIPLSYKIVLWIWFEWATHLHFHSCGMISRDDMRQEEYFIASLNLSCASNPAMKVAIIVIHSQILISISLNIKPSDNRLHTPYLVGDIIFTTIVIYLIKSSILQTNI